MNRKYWPGSFMFLALTTLSFASPAQHASEDLTRELLEASWIRIEGSIEKAFPRLDLARISKKIPSRNEVLSSCCKPESGYCESNMGCGFWRFDRDGFLVSEDMKTAIRKSPHIKIDAIRPNPDRTRWLGDYSDAGYAVISPDTGIAVILPDIHRKNTGAISWEWKTNNSLIGVTSERSPEMLKPNRYPETDLIPGKIFFFLYEFNDTGGKMYYISALPKTRRGMLVRLEGVTPKGGLVLSEINPDKYWDVEALGRMLGVFDIAPPRSE
jgi:hypothetical protein